MFRASTPIRGNVPTLWKAVSELACRLAYRAAIPWAITDNCEQDDENAAREC